jgi:ribosomal protein S18 acetylase RimI-like enzyme
MTLIYRVKTASQEEIYAHLAACDMNLAPPMSSRVNLQVYARKIFEKAVSFEVWDGNVLVGMLNAYLNDTTLWTGYITNVSILKEYMRQGIASTLLQLCLEHAQKDGFSKIKLEVSPANDPAIKLYARAGFKAIQESGDSLIMACDIIGKSTEEL